MNYKTAHTNTHTTTPRGHIQPRTFNLHPFIPSSLRRHVFVAAPTSGGEPYARAAIFPWGAGKQKGPDGEAVVSARAIKHVDCLKSAVSRGKGREAERDKQRDGGITVYYLQ